MKLLEGDKLLAQVSWLHPKGRGGPWHLPPLQGLAPLAPGGLCGFLPASCPQHPTCPPLPPRVTSRDTCSGTPQPPGLPLSRPSAVRPAGVLRAPRGPGDAPEPTLAEEVAALPLCWVHPRPERWTGSPALRPVGKLPWACRAGFFMGWGRPPPSCLAWGHRELRPGLSPARPQHGDDGSGMGDEVGAERRWSWEAVGG